MKLLIVHGLRADSRLTNLQHATAFARHSFGVDVTYVNCFGFITDEVLDTKFEMVVVTYEVLAQRNTPFWQALEKRLLRILKNCQTRVLMPQDDYSSCGVLDDFVCASNAQFVYSPITEDLEVLYPRAVSQGVKFFEALTGYWETQTTLPFTKFRRPFRDRSIDVGQRVRHLPPQLGVEASRKGYLAVTFAEQSRIMDFQVDVSTRDEDVLVGDDWWRFLGDTRFTIGRLGGASIGDPKGKLAQQVYRMRIRRPDISESEILKKLNWRNAKSGNFTAISPRLFEAAAMGVCQILENDHYFDGFEAWKHYVPLSYDLSNINEVFHVMRDFARCEEIVRESEAFLIKSDRFTYKSFVASLLHETVDFRVDESLPPTVRDIDDEAMSQENSRLTSTLRRHPFQKANRRATDRWLAAYRRDELMPESFFIPWISAQAALSRS
jgi:hypothetical protein